MLIEEMANCATVVVALFFVAAILWRRDRTPKVDGEAHDSLDLH